MAVASTSTKNLEHALGEIGSSFAIASRSGHPLEVEDQVSGNVSGNDGAVVATVPACHLEDLGDASFRSDHGLRYALMSGAMANGIGSVEIVEAMGQSGFLGIFGAAGLPLAAVDKAIDRIERGACAHDSLWSEPDSQPGRARAGIGRRRPVAAARRAARGGVGVFEPDFAGGSLSRRGPSAR